MWAILSAVDDEHKLGTFCKLLLVDTDMYATLRAPNVMMGDYLRACLEARWRASQAGQARLKAAAKAFRDAMRQLRGWHSLRRLLVGLAEINAARAANPNPLERAPITVEFPLTWESVSTYVSATSELVVEGYAKHSPGAILADDKRSTVACCREIIKEIISSNVQVNGVYRLAAHSVVSTSLAICCVVKNMVFHF